MSNNNIQTLPLDEELEEKLYDYINQYNGLPNGVKMLKAERLEAKPPSVMVQIVPNSEVETRFITESYIGRVRFGIFCKLDVKDTRTTFDGFRILRDINKWFTERERAYKKEEEAPPPLGTNNTYNSIEMTMSPAVVDELDNGEFIYGAQFKLLYLHI